VFGDFGVNQFSTMAAQSRQCAGLVLAHQAAVAGNISRQNGREAALDPLSAQRFPPWQVDQVCSRGEPGSTRLQPPALLPTNGMCGHFDQFAADIPERRLSVQFRRRRRATPDGRSAPITAILSIALEPLCLTESALESDIVQAE